MANNNTLYEIATTRCPDFSGPFRFPEHGYQQLGFYHSDAWSRRGASSFQYGPSEEVMNIDPNAPATKKLLRNWARLQIRPECHFIIIFEGYAEQLQQERRSVTPPSLEAVTTPSHDLHQPLQSSTSSPPSSPPPASPSSHAQPESRLPGLGDPNFQLKPGTSIPDVCEAVGIPRATMRRAQFSPATRVTPFHALLVNFLSILYVLQVLNLEEPRSFCIYPGGLQLAMESVLGHFNWGLSSYHKKLVAFRWAKMAAVAQWNTRYSVQGEPEAYFYRVWRGIVWYFKPGGGVDRNVAPQKITGLSRCTSDEQAAAELKQTALLEQRSELEQFLIFSES
ncbi:hypothetical protein BDN72DRAFT_864818 [Pluteus cervinus]|uniref:Uncharacterized protein n=1 Tax=Pluteus cervinus TaxID=181527 RepID=A0ACD3A3I9_9AGAR|nr:hypothetical protein BDN72DRAFT_864818 [Pluteus cervinus]